jgi:hypothetical protein
MGCNVKKGHIMFRISIWVIALFCAMTFGTPAGKADAPISNSSGPTPDPSHIPITLPANIRWAHVADGEDQAILFGDPNNSGLYGLLIRWTPGHFSQPHFHDKDRYAYVISGTWWVSSSAHFDPAKTYPLPAGTFAEDIANTVHWDGARSGDDGPAILELVGMGPVKTIRVDENGAPLPSSPR